MKVEIINKIQVKNLFKNWGTTSATCYATPKKYADKVGKSCLASGHFSGSRTEYIKFEITEVPRSLVDQLVRHEVGVVKNVRSQRYCVESNFNYYTPPQIEKDADLKDIWDAHMKSTSDTYSLLVSKLNDKGLTGEKANEIARGVLPMDIHSAVTIAFTVEALINLMNKRLCVRSQLPIRKLAEKMRDEVLKLLPELEDKLVPICEHQLWCPEGKMSCGKAPSKDELLSLMSYAIVKGEQEIRELMGNEEDRLTSRNDTGN